MTMKMLALNSVVYKEGKHFVSQCLDVDVSSFGTSEQEALDKLKEALDLYFEDIPTSQITTVTNPTLHTLKLKHA